MFPRNAQRRRQNTAKAVNPIPYRADYFGHKLHMDQNEKLQMYGVTHVVAIDGHSRFVVAYSTMPVKNNMVIYKDVYRYQHYIASFSSVHSILAKNVLVIIYTFKPIQFKSCVKKSVTFNTYV